MAEEVLVRVEGVGKKFCRDLRTSLKYGLRDLAGEVMGRPRTSTLRQKEFWAVHDVGFEVQRGQCLGLIGRNGAGKTTLLKMLNGLIKPDVGRIEMRGRIGALIALGAGFNPILTGRENIFINGAVLGFSRKEIKSRLDDIIQFAEIEEFIDTPVRNYSSGMNVRLGFAVASSMDPDVLILDEVLAVGDAAFRSKCYRRIADIRRNSAVIFVSHNMEQVSRICDIGLVMDHGRIHFKGDTESTVAIYEDLNVDAGSDAGFVSLHRDIEEFKVFDVPKEINTGGAVKIRLALRSLVRWDRVRIRVGIFTIGGMVAASSEAQFVQNDVSIGVGHTEFEIEMPFLPFRRGAYYMNVNIVDDAGDMIAWAYRTCAFKIIGGVAHSMAVCALPSTIRRSSDHLQPIGVNKGQE